MSKKNSESNPVVKFVILYILLALALFLPVGTIFWLQGWIYIMIMIIFSSILILFLKKKDPELLKARAKTRVTESWDKKISLVSGIFFIAMYILPGFDAVRFQWSIVPFYINIIGFIGMNLSLIFFFWLIVKILIYQESLRFKKNEVIKSLQQVPIRLFAIQCI